MMNVTHPDLPTRPHLDEDDDDPRGGRPGRDSTFFDRQLTEARILQITGPITDTLARYCATRLLVMEQLDADKPITVFINSPGGSADSGFAMYDMLRYVRPRVRTVVNGLCASAAILVLLAADKKDRFSLPESRFLLHQPSTMGRGTAADLDITAREILKLRDRYNRIVAETCSQELERIVEDTRRDFWLSANEAKEYGLVSRIVVGAEEVA